MIKTWNLGQRRIVLKDNTVLTYYYLPMYPRAGNYVARQWWVARGKVWTKSYRDSWFGSGLDGVWKTNITEKEFNAIIEKLKSVSEVNEALRIVEELYAKGGENNDD